MNDKVIVGLGGVQETLLWNLYQRASESAQVGHGGLVAGRGGGAG